MRSLQHTVSDRSVFERCVERVHRNAYESRRGGEFKKQNVSARAPELVGRVLRFVCRAESTTRRININQLHTDRLSKTLPSVVTRTATTGSGRSLENAPVTRCYYYYVHIVCYSRVRSLDVYSSAQTMLLFLCNVSTRRPSGPRTRRRSLRPAIQPPHRRRGNVFPVANDNTAKIVVNIAFISAAGTATQPYDDARRRSRSAR